MPTDVFSKHLDLQKMLNLQTIQYQERLLISDEVDAGESVISRVNISSLGAFRLLWMTGSYTTLETDAATIVDTGVTRLRGKMFDGGTSKELFSDYIPFNLFLSPGRARRQGVFFEDAGATRRADFSNDLFYPIEFDYVFMANSEIIFDVKNDASAKNYFSICFHGIRLKQGNQIS